MLAQKVRTKTGLVRCPFCGAIFTLHSAHVSCVACGILPFPPAAALRESGENIHRPGLELLAVTKEGAVHEMVDTLARYGAIESGDVPGVVRAILRREQVVTTGIGSGVAIPHVRHRCVKHVVGTVAWSRTGIEFQSVDRLPVHQLFLLLTPPDHARQHLQALAAISRAVQSQDPFIVDPDSTPNG